MAGLSEFTSWIASMFAKGVSTITRSIGEALGIAERVLPEVDIPTFVDVFRESMREEVFSDMIQDKTVSQSVKDTEFLESNDTFPRNYLARFYVQWTDPTTGETVDGYRNMYVDDRLPNRDLENIFIDKWQMGSSRTDQGFTFVSFDTLTHSKGSPYGAF